MWDFPSIAQGIRSADEIAKHSPVATLLAGTTHPGRYVVLVGGDTASVEVACDTIRESDPELHDHRFLPDVADEVVAAMVDGSSVASSESEAIGIVETTSVSSAVDAADGAVKAAHVRLDTLRLADDLGGKSYLIVEGDIGSVEAGADAAAERAGSALIEAVVIAQLTPELRHGLAASTLFLERLRTFRRTST